MKTVRLSLFGIPAHAVVNDMPGSLLPAASLCDLLYLLTSDRSWLLAGFRLLQLGNYSAFLAGALGVLDFLRLPATPELRRIGKRHAIMNGVVLPLFVLCQLQRRGRPARPSRAAMLLLLAANVGLNVSAWNGARLLYRHQVRTGESGSMAPLAARVEPVTW